MDEHVVWERSGLALHRQAIQDEIDRLELMVKAADHAFLRAHLLEELEGCRAELEAIADLIGVRARG